MDEFSIATCKIIIAGSFSSGKTTFIDTISEKNPSTDPMTTVAMDFGRITIEENRLVLYLFATPGARRFDHMWEILAEGALGLIMMVDSRYPEMFRETRAIAQFFNLHTRPHVFAANFQDLPDAWNVDALRMALRIPNEIPIIHCNARDRDSVKAVLIALMEAVLRDITNSFEEDQSGKSIKKDESENTDP